MVHKGGSMEFRSDGGNLLRKSVACISAMIVASAILQSGTASAQERERSGGTAGCYKLVMVLGLQRTALVRDATLSHPWPRLERRSTFHSFRRPTRSAIRSWQARFSF